MLCQIFDRESILLVDVILLFRFIMPNGKTAFAQIIDLVPNYVFITIEQPKLIRNIRV